LPRVQATNVLVGILGTFVRVWRASIPSFLRGEIVQTDGEIRLEYLVKLIRRQHLAPWPRRLKEAGRFGYFRAAALPFETFHDWHLEIFKKPSDHAPQVGDPTPIICEITPRTERIIYRDGVRIQSLAGFFRLQDTSYRATGHPARKVRVTGYLLWDDEHNGSADVGSTVEYFSRNGFHHPWRSTA
jgi:hypothetical protein